MPDPVQTETWLVVKRKGRVTGAANTYYLTIDGATDTVAGGEVVQLRIKPGAHDIELRVVGAVSKRISDSFDIAAGQTVEYEIAFSGWSGAKFNRLR